MYLIIDDKTTTHLVIFDFTFHQKVEDRKENFQKNFLLKLINQKENPLKRKILICLILHKKIFD